MIIDTDNLKLVEVTGLLHT